MPLFEFLELAKASNSALMNIKQNLKVFLTEQSQETFRTQVLLV